MARPNVYCSRFVGSLANGVDIVIKGLWDLCWWECCYFSGWCDEMFMGAVLLGVWLLLGRV